MKAKLLLSFALILSLFSLFSAAQEQGKVPDASSKGSGGGGKITTTAAAPSSARVVITATTTPLDLARAAYLAQGGDKYRDLKSIVLSGTVDLYAPSSLQSLPGKFVVVSAGDRSRLEIQSPVFNFRQIADGDKTFTSIRGIEFPSLTKTGINALMKYNRPGFTVSALPDNKKLRAFRITDPEGYVTDFSIDPATGRVISYFIPYQGYGMGVENKTLKEVEGVLIPHAFSQRIETPQGAYFADYKVKDVKLDQVIADDVFEMPAP